MVVSTALASPMLPAVDVIFKVGVVRLPKEELVILEFEVNDTDVLPLTEPDRVNDPPVAVNSTVPAEALPALALLRLLPVTRLKSLPAEEAL